MEGGRISRRKETDWSKYNFEIQPITKDLLDTLPKFERSKALEAYHDWLNRQRETDAEYAIKELDLIQGMKRKCKNREAMKRIRKDRPNYFRDAMRRSKKKRLNSCYIQSEKKSSEDRKMKGGEGECQK
jgi:hypothetical protein